MNVWSKLMTALRGGVNEAGETIVDTQALRILDQEIREAADELNNSKAHLAEMMARGKVAEKKCQILSEQIIEFEDYTLQALEKNDGSLAQELAEKIAALEDQHQQEQNAHNDGQQNIKHLRNAIKKTDENIKRLKHQVDTVRATENVQRAQAVVAQRHNASNSKINTAMDSLERIKEKQALKSATLSATEELAEETVDNLLQDKLKAAGIVSSLSKADEVLERLKKQVTPRITHEGD